MKNLAGVKECDDFIREELLNADINIIEMKEPSTGEVPYSIYGTRYGLKFTRAWYYMIVTGHVDIVPARVLESSPRPAAKECRVAGYAGGAPVLDWIVEVDPKTGLKRVTPEDWEKQKAGFEKHPTLKEMFDREYVVADKDPDRFIETVDCYHIDSQAGLMIFMDILKTCEKNMAPLIDLNCRINEIPEIT